MDRAIAQPIGGLQQPGPPWVSLAVNPPYARVMKYSPHPEERCFSGASRRMATCTAVPVDILPDARKRAAQDEVRHCCTCTTGSRLQILRRRVIARIDRIGQE